MLVGSFLFLRCTVAFVIYDSGRSVMCVCVLVWWSSATGPGFSFYGTILYTCVSECYHVLAKIYPNKSISSAFSFPRGRLWVCTACCVTTADGPWFLPCHKLDSSLSMCTCGWETFHDRIVLTARFVLASPQRCRREFVCCDFLAVTHVCWVGRLGLCRVRGRCT